MHVPGAAQFGEGEDVVLLFEGTRFRRRQLRHSGLHDGRVQRCHAGRADLRREQHGRLCGLRSEESPRTLWSKSSIPLEVFEQIRAARRAEAAHNQFQQSSTAPPATASRPGITTPRSECRARNRRPPRRRGRRHRRPWALSRRTVRGFGSIIRGARAFRWGVRVAGSEKIMRTPRATTACKALRCPLILKYETVSSCLSRWLHWQCPCMRPCFVRANGTRRAATRQATTFATAFRGWRSHRDLGSSQRHSSREVAPDERIVLDLHHQGGDAVPYFQYQPAEEGRYREHLRQCAMWRVFVVLLHYISSISAQIVGVMSAFLRGRESLPIHCLHLQNPERIT